MELPALRWPARVGLERFSTGFELPRHQHAHAHATVVFGHRVDQASYAGRFQLEAGDVLVQPSFDCHVNQTIHKCIELLRIPWPRETGLGGLYRNCDVDAVRRAAESDVPKAARLLADELTPDRREAPLTLDWPDLLAADIRCRLDLQIAPWARAMGLRSETVSRGFRAAFGVTPSQFRGELRARDAWVRLVCGVDALAAVASDSGFYDQAHMTRQVKWLTGATPGAWRETEQAANKWPPQWKTV